MLPGMSGGMASSTGLVLNTPPSVRGTATYVSTSASTSHTINLPSGIQSGDLLYVFYRGSTAASNMSLPSGWLWYSSNSPLVKIASGSEGTTLATSWGSSVNVAAVAVCISGNRNGTSLSEISFILSAGTQNPPQLTPSWGIDNNLWGVAISAVETNATVATWPDGFTLNQTSAVHATASCAVHVAFRTDYADSLDPTTFALNNVSGAFDGAAMTFAVRPV